MPHPIDNLGKFYLYVNNRGQAYVPNRRGLFGGATKPLPKLEEVEGRKTEFEFDFHLKKVQWDSISTDKMPCACDKGDRAPDTTRCITSWLERKIGCSMSLLGADPRVPK